MCLVPVGLKTDTHARVASWICSLPTGHLLGMDGTAHPGETEQRRGEERRGKERRGEERRGQDRTGQDRTGEQTAEAPLQNEQAGSLDQPISWLRCGCTVQDFSL